VQFVGADDGFRARVDHYIESIPRKSRVPSVRLLSMARDLLRTHGLDPAPRAGTPVGSYCLTGAAGRRRPARMKRSTGERCASIGERLNVPLSLGGYGCHAKIVGWNDQEGRTKHEVIAKLEEVIAPSWSPARVEVILERGGQLDHHLLRIAEEHQRLVPLIELVVDAGEARPGCA